MIPESTNGLIKCDKLVNSSLQEYLDLSHSTEELAQPYRIIRYDNYLSLFLRLYPDLLEQCFWATHKNGAKPKWDHGFDVAPWELPGNLSYWINDSKETWVVNVDLDYFFHTLSGEEDSEYELMFSNEYMIRVFESIRDGIKNAKIRVLTIALSPECCGGWQNAKMLCKKISDIMKLDFQLPYPIF